MTTADAGAVPERAKCPSCDGSGYASTPDGQDLGECSTCGGFGTAPSPRVVPEPAAEPVDLMAALRRSIDVAREERRKRDAPTPAEESEPVDD